MEAIGLRRIGIGTFGVAALAVACLAVSTGVVSAVQRLFGLPIGDRAAYEAITRTPFARRVFIVLTAGIVEEVLYRGIGIGGGAAVLGQAPFAAIVSTAAFVAAHFRWRPSHLLQVSAAGAVLATTFVLTGDLWVCVLAHTAVDAIGFLLVPALIVERARRVGETGPGGRNA